MPGQGGQGPEVSPLTSQRGCNWGLSPGSTLP